MPPTPYPENNAPSVFMTKLAANASPYKKSIIAATPLYLGPNISIRNDVAGLNLSNLSLTTSALVNSMGLNMPFFAKFNNFPISCGASAIIPVKIIKDVPFPMPLIDILVPNQIKINVPQSIVNAEIILN